MKMIHDIRYVGLAGEINFSKEPYMYQDTDLFNYNIEYDLNYFPSGRGGKVKRFKQWPQVNTLTLGVINRTDVRELVSKLERHFQVDINAKTPAKLFVNGSYTECYIVSSVKTYFNRFLGINFITLEILREKPVWTIEEEFSYQRADLQTNPYDLNLIKPPYDFSELEFTQPAKPLEEANLILNGWDDFGVYGNEGEKQLAPMEVFEKGYAKNYFSYKNFKNKGWFDGIEVYRYKKLDNIGNKITIRTDLFEGKEKLDGLYVAVSNHPNPNKSETGSVFISNGNVRQETVDLEFDKDDDIYLSYYPRDYNVEHITNYKIAIYSDKTGVNYEKHFLNWEDCPKKDLIVPAWDNMAVLKTPLGNGLTRIQTWGGNARTKILRRQSQLLTTFSMYVENLSESTLFILQNKGSIEERLGSKERKLVTLTSKPESNNSNQIHIRARASLPNNLDFIASDPVIYEDDGSMIYDIEEYDDKYRVRTMNSHSKTKVKLPIKKSVFKNEQYTHSLYVENNGNNDVLFKSKEGLYLENPVIEIKPDEKGTYAYTGTVSQDSLYINFELATKEVEDELDLVLAKPAVRYGDKPFDWPPEEEIIPLRLPTHIPFWITADDSIKYISNNSIGDTLAKITIFGPIKNPTLYIGSNTYRVYEELLENERIEIDQRAKTVIKVTASGDRVNVFHLRDKEHSVFKPIPEGENTVTQNDDFSYTIVLYHERNEPQWT